MLLVKLMTWKPCIRSIKRASGNSYGNNKKYVRCKKGLSSYIIRELLPGKFFETSLISLMSEPCLSNSTAQLLQFLHLCKKLEIRLNTVQFKMHISYEECNTVFNYAEEKTLDLQKLMEARGNILKLLSNILSNKHGSECVYMYFQNHFVAFT